MAFKLAEAFVEFRQRGLTKTQRSVTSLGSSMRTVGGIARGFAAQMAAIGVGLGVGGILKLAADAETLQVQFEVLLGSADAAKRKIKELREFAASTPFEITDLGAAMKTLLGFDVAADEVIGVLKKLGDISALSGKDIKELAALYGKAAVNGRLFADDVTRLAETGIPIFKTLEKRFGVTGAALRKLVEGGKADFSVLVEAIDSATGAGGKFENGAARLAATTTGKFSTAVDNMKAALAELGKDFLPLAKDVLDAVTLTAKWLKTVLLPTVKDVFGGFSRALGYTVDGFNDLVDAIDGGTGALKSFFRAFSLGVFGLDIDWSNVLDGIGFFGRHWEMTLQLAMLRTEAWVIDVAKEINSLPGKLDPFVLGLLGPAGLLMPNGNSKELDEQKKNNITHQNALLSMIAKAEDERLAKRKAAADKEAADKAAGVEDAAGKKSSGPDILAFDALAKKIQTAGDNPVVNAIKEGNEILKAIELKGGAAGGNADEVVKKAARKFGHIVLGPGTEGFDKGREIRQKVADQMRQKSQILGRTEMKEFFRDPADADKARQQQRQMVASVIAEKGGTASGAAEIKQIVKQLKATHELLSRKGIKTDPQPAVLVE